jgi:hypothetical protein
MPTATPEKPVESFVKFDLNRADKMSPEADAAIENLFTYHPWDAEQVTRGTVIRAALAAAVKEIIANVPPCPTRTIAIRKIVSARMDCNLAITLNGSY